MVNNEPQSIVNENWLIAHVDGASYAYTLQSDGSARLEQCTTDGDSLVIPDYLDGHLITETSHSAFYELTELRELEMPAYVRTIGPSSFTRCAKLEHLVLPKYLDRLDKAWLSGLKYLDEIVLPTAVETVDAEFMKACLTRTLVVGPHTTTVDVPPMWSTYAGTIVIDPANPHLSSDGTCLYSHDGSLLVACFSEEETCIIREGCREIGKKALAYNSKIKRLELPSTLEHIDEFAFLSTKLEEFVAPASLKTIAANAFMRCTSLRAITLNDGLESIGDGVFTSCTSLTHMEIPASTSFLGKRMVADTGLVGFAPNPTLTINPRNPYYRIDDSGVVYRHTPEGLVATDIHNPDLHEYCFEPGTVEIGDDAFASHPNIEHIVIPEGVITIGEGSFRHCPKLRTVELPSTLRSMKTRAFFNSRVNAMNIPAGLEFMGPCALGVEQQFGGAIYAASQATMRNITVDAANEHFFIENGLLCERMNGYAKVLQYLGPDDDVIVPSDVAEIAAYAFSGVAGLKRLRLHEGIAYIGTMGLSMHEPPRILEVELAEPIDGRTLVSLTPPQDSYGLRGMRNALSSSRVRAKTVVDQIDHVIPYTREYLTRIPYMINRLADPFMLSPVMKSCYRRTLDRSLAECMSTVAELEWEEGFDKLADMGIITSTNINSVIDDVNAKGHVACTAYLIALKRRRFDTQDEYAL